MAPKKVAKTAIRRVNAPRAPTAPPRARNATRARTPAPKLNARRARSASVSSRGSVRSLQPKARVRRSSAPPRTTRPRAVQRKPTTSRQAPARRPVAPRMTTGAFKNNILSSPVTHTHKMGSAHNLGHSHGHGHHHSGMSGGSGIRQVQQSFSWTTRLFNFQSTKGTQLALKQPAIRFLCSGGSPFFSYIKNSDTPDGSGNLNNEWVEGEWMPQAIKDISNSFEEYRLTKFNIRFVPVSKRVDHRGTITGMPQNSIFDQEIKDSTHLSAYPGSEERSPMQSFGNRGLEFNVASKLHRSKMQLVIVKAENAMTKSKITNTMGTIQETIAGIADFQMEDVAHIVSTEAKPDSADPMEYAVWIDASIQLFQFTGRKNEEWQNSIVFGPSAPETFVAKTFPNKITRSAQGDKDESCVEIEAQLDGNQSQRMVTFLPMLKSLTIENNFRLGDSLGCADCIHPKTSGFYKLNFQMHLSHVGACEAQIPGLRLAAPLIGSTIDVQFELKKKVIDRSEERPKIFFDQIVGIEGRTAWSASKIYTAGRYNNTKSIGNAEVYGSSQNSKRGTAATDLDIGQGDYFGVDRAWKTYVNVDTSGVLLHITQDDLDDGVYLYPLVKFRAVDVSSHTNPRSALDNTVTWTKTPNTASVVTPVVRVDSYQLTFTPVDNIDPEAVYDDFVTMDTLKVEDGRTFQRKDTFQSQQVPKRFTFAEVVREIDPATNFPGHDSSSDDEDSDDDLDLPTFPEEVFNDFDDSSSSPDFPVPDDAAPDIRTDVAVADGSSTRRRK